MAILWVGEKRSSEAHASLYTRAEDTLSAEDLIFPRAVTRVGTKYQANVLSWEEQQEAEAHHAAQLDQAGPSRLSRECGEKTQSDVAVERGYDPGEKKHESTLEVWCTPSDERECNCVGGSNFPVDAFMDEVRELKHLPVPSYDVRLLNRAALLFTTVGRDKALQTLKSLKLADFDPIIVSCLSLGVAQLTPPVGGRRNRSLRRAAGEEWRARRLGNQQGARQDTSRGAQILVHVEEQEAQDGERAHPPAP